MSDYSKNEFAALCRTTVAVLNTNISRKKLVFDKISETFDPGNIQNQIFLKRYQKKAEAEAKKSKLRNVSELYDKVVVKAGENPGTEKTKRRTSAEVEADKEAARKKSAKKVSFDERKTKADTELTEYRAAHEKLKLDKMNGKLIPIDLVFAIILRHNRTIYSGMEREFEAMASKYCDILAGGDRKYLAKIQDELNKKLDKIIKDTKTLADKEIEAEVDAYALTLNRGQRK